MNNYHGQIIDTHMHLWDTANGYEWLPKILDGALNSNFLMEDYFEMAKNQNISQMVHIECGGFPQNPVLETRWVQEQADKYGCPQGIIGFAELDSPDINKVLKEHAQYPNFRGIRMPLNYVAGCFGAKRDDYMRDPNWRKGYALLSKHDLLFEMQIFDPQIPDAVEIARQFPDTMIVLQHLGWPLQSTPEYMKEWKGRLAEIAQYPNVILKISCLGWIFQKCPEATIMSYLNEALRLFGPHRCIVGSNCPPDRYYLAFDEIFRLIKKAASKYSLLDQQRIFYGNAKRLYRL